MSPDDRLPQYRDGQHDPGDEQVLNLSPWVTCRWLCGLFVWYASALGEVLRAPSLMFVNVQVDGKREEIEIRPERGTARTVWTLE
jgi:hypothetical protein